jgi:mRNA degradation ribonuclease J1/J2
MGDVDVVCVVTTLDRHAHQLEQLIARAVSSWAFRTHRHKPLIIPVIIDA